MRPSVKERARAFVAKARPAIAGQNGHDATFAVACGLIVGFGLTDADAWELMLQYNVGCQPAWSEKELRRKLSEARKQADRNPSEVGKLAEQDAPNYTGPRTKPVVAQPSERGVRAGGLPVAGKTARTARTPFFEVHRAGSGRSCAPSRTLRTVLSYSNPYSEKNKIHVMDGSEKQPSEASDARTVRTAPAELIKKPSTNPAPARPVAPVKERVDVTVVSSDGEVFRKTWKQKDFQRIGNLNQPKQRA